MKKAAFAMGCFWGTEALFGVTKGVLRTKVGYAGGSSANPTYRNIADHIETVELEFDENQVSYEVSLILHFDEYLTQTFSQTETA